MNEGYVDVEDEEDEDVPLPQRDLIVAAMAVGYVTRTIEASRGYTSVHFQRWITQSEEGPA